jgi:hypothetical protein
MKRRQASPTPSEHEVDIAAALFAEDWEEDATANATAAATSTATKTTTAKANKAVATDLDLNDLLNAGGDSEDDGDAEFIASRQRSSNRKASNLQGKSVKKGGGFQAMGKKLLLPLVACVRLLTLLCRSQFPAPPSHHEERLLRADSNSAKNNPSDP